MGESLVDAIVLRCYTFCTERYGNRRLLLWLTAILANSQVPRCVPTDTDVLRSFCTERYQILKGLTWESSWTKQPS